MALAFQGATVIIRATDLAHAVSVAVKEAKTGDAVLLSPACASLDMFDNFEHRGNVFMALVNDLYHQS